MAKRRRGADSGGTTSAAATYNVVFIDTNIDTHLAVVTSDSDTVSDLKDNIVLEHGRCFPEIGDVKIHALKVKRRGHFYHLPDYMPVKSAFEGAKKNWFLSVEVIEQNDVLQVVNPGAGNQKGLLVENNLLVHDQDHLPDEQFKVPCGMPEVEGAKALIGSSSRPTDFTGEVSKDVMMEENYSSSKHAPENELPAGSRSPDKGKVDASVVDPDLSAKVVVHESTVGINSGGKKKKKKEEEKNLKKLNLSANELLSQETVVVIEGAQLYEANKAVSNVENVSKTVENITEGNQNFAAKSHQSVAVNDNLNNKEITALGDVFINADAVSGEQGKKEKHTQLNQTNERNSKKETKENHLSSHSPSTLIPIKDQVAAQGEVSIVAADNRLKEVDTPSKEPPNFVRQPLDSTNAPKGNSGMEEELLQLNQTNTKKSKRKMRKSQVTDHGPTLLANKHQVPVQYVVSVEASGTRLKDVETPSKEPASSDHLPQYSTNVPQDDAEKTIKKRKKSTRVNHSSKARKQLNLSMEDKSKDIASVTHNLIEPESPFRTENDQSMEFHLNQVPVTESECQKDGVASQCRGDEINCKQYFVASQLQDEVAKESSAKTVAEKKADEDVVPSLGTAHKLQQGLLKSNHNESAVSSAGKVSNLLKSSKGTKTKKKAAKGGVPYATTASDLEEMKTPEKPVAASLFNDSDANKTVPRKKEKVKSLVVGSRFKSSSKSSSGLPLSTGDEKEPGSRHQVKSSKRTASKLGGEVVNNSKQEKSLGSTRKPIFRDLSGESSGDENGYVDSVASTRMQSDNSSFRLFRAGT